MRVLVIGSGGREHALAWRLGRDGHTVFAAPGNPGMASVSECVTLAVEDRARVVEFARQRRVELVVVGPEAPLVAGLADELRAAGIPVFGPGKKGAQLEGSKRFGKEFFVRHGIRTAPFHACRTMAEVDAALKQLGGLVVVKADGLAAGKGVFVCDDEKSAQDAARSMLEGQAFGDAGRVVIVEKRLSGRELSVMALTDGKTFEVLAPAEDHKTIYDGDKGPNTGGMGTVSPASWATRMLLDVIEREILAPTVGGLAKEGIDYRGVLYAGLMVDDKNNPWLLEYNCRFGDPETQPVMARVVGNFGDHLLGCARGQLPQKPLEWDPRTAVCVVLASAGYPGPVQGPTVIRGHDQISSEEALVFHAGTAQKGSELVTNGGRVMSVCALGDDVLIARARAYRAVDKIRFDGMQFRRDIGARKT
jgi:phosphoribosylamine--glycine ligase